MNKSGSTNSSSKKKTAAARGKAAAPRSKKTFWLRLASDVIIAGVIFGVFYLFLEIMPQYRQFQKMKEAMTAETAVSAGDASVEPEETAEITYDETEEAAASSVSVENASDQTETETAPQAAVIEAAGDTEASLEAAEVSEADNAADITGLTLKERFAEFFTEEKVKDSTSYTSPNVSVQITKVNDEEHGSKPFTAYIADIHVASVENLQAGFPSGTRTAEAELISKDNHAVMAVNGDFYLNINNGLIVRNGAVLQNSEGTADICVLYEDGTMKTYVPGEYSAEAILNQHPYQVWSFGPELLDEDGMPKEEFNTSTFIYNRNPRTAIGYYEPGHYCLVVIDGRYMGNSNGASMRALASLMADLGCSVAYNLDGGGSSTMVYNNKVVNIPSGGGRKISDIVMICELPEPEPEPEPVSESAAESEPVSEPAAEPESESELQPESEPEPEAEPVSGETITEEEGQAES